MMQARDSYRGQRDQLLSEVIEFLSRDERFVAAWLTGSFSRNEADLLSDIDLSVVVSETDSTDLCGRHDQVSAQTSSERYSLFSQFGTPALIHENNNNAPEGGTFTFVLYEKAAIMVDWVLIPQSRAKRPAQVKLLFDKVTIPVEAPAEPERLEQRQKSVAEMWAFFWMMTAVTIKYIIRNDGVFVTEWIEHLHSIHQEIKRKIDGQPWRYTPGSLSQLQPTREKQIESLKLLCERMQELKSKVTDFIGSEPLTPLVEIETLLSFSSNAHSKIENDPA